MKISFFLFVLLPLVVAGQKPTSTNSNQKADSIVAHFLGEEIFQRFVQLDLKKSREISQKTYFFQYNFKHPKFSGKTFVISFMLDSTGQFLPNENVLGLIKNESANDSTWVSGQQALKISKGQSYHIKKKSLRLAWDAVNLSYDLFQKTHNFRDIVPGELVWEIDGEVEFRGERYSGTFQVNVFTGTVAKQFAIPWD